MNEQNENIIEVIKSIFYQLPVTERKVAQVIIKEPEAIQYLSIGELAEKACTSNATITRFCRHLQLSGFYEFKIELAKSLITGRKNTVTASSKGVISDARKNAIYVINETADKLSEKDIELATKRIEKADRVLCAGTGGSMLIAAECSHLFSTVCTKFIVVPDFHMQLHLLSTMMPDDVIILFSYSGATKSGMELLKEAKKRNIFTILITGYLKSPLSQESDLALCCEAHEKPFDTGSTAAKIAMMLTADLMFRKYSERNPEDVKRVSQAIAQVISQQHL